MSEKSNSENFEKENISEDDVPVDEVRIDDVEENNEKSTTSSENPTKVEDETKQNIHPVQILINAVGVAHNRGAYTFPEASLINQALEVLKRDTNLVVISSAVNTAVNTAQPSSSA